jgi:tetratricopeptide (TPR) repeat protein
MKCVLCASLAFVIFAFGPECAAGQDLGSSNKLFGSPRSTPSKKASTKKAAPRRASRTKRSAARPKPGPAATAEEKKARTPQRQPAAKPLPETRDVPVSAAAAALYERLIDDGNGARDDRDYANAEKAYTRARAIKPRDARAVYGLGNLYSDQQRWDDAETAYRAALALDPKDPFVHIALSYVLSQPIFVEDLADRYKEAEDLARRAIELAPSNALAYDQLGVSMELRGLIGPETESAYRNAIRLAPSFAPPYAHLGRLMRRRGALSASDAAYQNAVRYSTDVPTMILVADVMQSEQRYADSEPLLRQALAGDPRNPTGLILLARALTATGKFDDAERVLHRSLDVSPNGFVPNLLLGSLYSRQARYEQAETALTRALRSVPHNEKRSLSLQFESVGDGYMKSGRSRNAERAYRQALALDAQKDSLADKLARAQHS